MTGFWILQKNMNYFLKLLNEKMWKTTWSDQSSDVALPSSTLQGTHSALDVLKEPYPSSPVLLYSVHCWCVVKNQLIIDKKCIDTPMNTYQYQTQKSHKC